MTFWAAVSNNRTKLLYFFCRYSTVLILETAVCSVDMSVVLECSAYSSLVNHRHLPSPALLFSMCLRSVCSLLCYTIVRDLRCLCCCITSSWRRRPLHNLSLFLEQRDTSAPSNAWVTLSERYNECLTLVFMKAREECTHKKSTLIYQMRCKGGSWEQED